MFSGQLFDILVLPGQTSAPMFCYIYISKIDANLRGFFRALTVFQNNSIYCIWLRQKDDKINWNKFRNNVRSSNVGAIKQAWSKQLM